MMNENSLGVLEVKKETFTIMESGSVTSPRGFLAGGVHCGIKKKRLDLGWVYSVIPAVAAGVYTTNQFQAAPLIVTKESVAFDHKIQGILVNSGVANACTGDRGLVDAYAMRKMFADKLGMNEHHVAVASTGVIGAHLPMDKIKAGINDIEVKQIQSETDGFENAILTTDTCTKHIGVQLEIDGKLITIGGAAKGSGMIHPNMATMLGFVTTDAYIEHEDLSLALKNITNKTFNMITVDGDTSTNDMVLVLANGVVQNDKLTEQHPAWSLFMEGLSFVCQELAKQIARDGEGATKLVEVIVKGAETDQAAQTISKSIVGSNLVKTAIYGTDANWGRIVCAIGYSGSLINPQTVKVSLGPITVVDDGLPGLFDEQKAKAYLEQELVQIFVELKQGKGSAVAWGCDLTYDYVRINASYRT